MEIWESYLYNGLGIRVSTEAGKGITHTLRDYAGDYSHVLMEETEGIQTDYLWGEELELQQTADRKLYYCCDRLGSPSRLLTGTGEQYVYGYDEFGNDLSRSTGNSENRTPYTEQGSIQPFGYTGYHYSSISAAYHALAREYNPLTGSFLSRDSDHYLNPDEPQSLNQYLYCLSNPLRYTDPYGHEAGSINQKLTAIGIRDTFLGGIKSMYEDIIYEGIQSSLTKYLENGIEKVKG